jgi:hypothetical protein
MRLTGGTVSCNALQDSYDDLSTFYMARNDAVSALEDEWGGAAWGEVEFVRAYCEIEKALYEGLADGAGYTRPGRVALAITAYHPDSVSGEPRDGIYVMEGTSVGEDPPDVGRGVEPYAFASQAEYLVDFGDVYADAFDCNIESASDPYFDSSALEGAWITHQITGTLEITDSSDSSVKAEITDGQLLDSNSQPDGEFAMATTTFPLCEIEYESPFGGPEPDPVPGR